MSDDSQTTDQKDIPAPVELEGKDLGTSATPKTTGTPDGLIAAPNIGTSTDSEFLTGYSGHLHSYIREYISVADRKASFTFAISAALLVYLYEKGIASSWIKTMKVWGFSDLVAAVASIGLFVSVVLAVSVVFPRMSSSRRGFIFWESVADFETASEFSEETAKLSRARLTDEVLRHAYELSKVCKSKYWALNWSLRAGGIGAVSAIFYLFL